MKFINSVLNSVLTYEKTKVVSHTL